MWSSLLKVQTHQVIILSTAEKKMIDGRTLAADFAALKFGGSFRTTQRNVMFDSGLGYGVQVFRNGSCFYLTKGATISFR